MLRELQWLPSYQRMRYNILLYVWIALQGQAPDTSSSLFRFTILEDHSALLAEAIYFLVHASTMQRTKDYFQRWRAAHIYIWNYLPESLGVSGTKAQFKSSLKTRLFREHFSGYFWACACIGLMGSILQRGT